MYRGGSGERGGGVGVGGGFGGIVYFIGVWIEGTSLFPSSRPPYPLPLLPSPRP